MSWLVLCLIQPLSSSPETAYLDEISWATHLIATSGESGYITIRATTLESVAGPKSRKTDRQTDKEADGPASQLGIHNAYVYTTPQFVHCAFAVSDDGGGSVIKLLCPVPGARASVRATGNKVPASLRIQTCTCYVSFTST